MQTRLARTVEFFAPPRDALLATLCHRRWKVGSILTEILLKNLLINILLVLNVARNLLRMYVVKINVKSLYDRICYTAIKITRQPPSE